MAGLLLILLLALITILYIWKDDVKEFFRTVIRKTITFFQWLKIRFFKTI